jgi:NAD(P)H-dependent FMN reductase
LPRRSSTADSSPEELHRRTSEHLRGAYHEFNRKSAAYVGYGSVGGARAIEQLRLMNIDLQMAPTRSGVHIGGGDFAGLLMQGKSFEEMPHLAQSAAVMLDELAWWTKALKTARDADAVPATA